MQAVTVFVHFEGRPAAEIHQCAFDPHSDTFEIGPMRSKGVVKRVTVPRLRVGFMTLHNLTIVLQASVSAEPGDMLSACKVDVHVSDSKSML